MIKKNLKLFTILLITLAVISSFSLCFAEETNETAIPTQTAETTNESTNEEIHEGDLYVFENNITMDQLVDGNVYIMGKNITVSGQINGNLFVFGDSIKFDNCYVRYSIYACANNIYYNGACNDLYAATSQKLEMTYDSYVVRDVKAVSNSTILKAAIGRDVDLQTNSIDFGADAEVPIIYGNLRYSANQEKTLADGIVEGEVTYSPNKITDGKSISENIGDILVAFLTIIATTLVMYAIISKIKPEYTKKLSSDFSPVYLLKCFGIGLLTLIAGIVISFILLMTTIGINLAFILAFILVLIGLFATPIMLIYINNLLKPVLKVEKIYLYYIILALVAVIFKGLTLIPFVGGWIGFIIFILGYGLIVNSALPHKELSEEEITKKLEEKEAKKVLKAEKKAEKAKLKEAKKAEKNNLKEDKKSKKE